MLNSFLIILNQVLVLFLLIVVGYLLGRKKLLSDSATGSLNSLILNVANPCIIVQAFQVDYAPEMLRGFLLAALAALAIHALNYGVGRLSTRKLGKQERAVYCLSCAMTNCGFLAFPLETALVGSAGIFYGSGYVAVMNLFTFTLGYYTFTHDRKSISLRQVLTRPSILALGLGLALFLLNIKLPAVIGSTVSHLSALCVPIPMLIIGYHLANADFRRITKNARYWLYSLLRLIVLPLLSIVLMVLLGLRGNVLLATAVAASCPAASMVTILAGKLGGDDALAAELNAFQTSLSLLTMPLVLTLASALA